jgi:hypothetical protein
MQLTLEKAYSDPIEAHAMLQQRLGVTIESVVIREIDFVRDTTEVKLSYFVDPAWGSSNAEAMSDSPEEMYTP